MPSRSSPGNPTIRTRRSSCRVRDSGDATAFHVKLPDIADNSDIHRLLLLTPAERSHLSKKYEAAMGLLLEGLIPTPILAEPPCAVCGRVASHVELVEPSERPAWTLIFSGVVAGNGSGRDIDAEEAGRIAFAFTQPYSSARIRVADLYDDAGFCGRCGVFYCAGHWRASSSGYGTCPNEHGKSLDPHWSPDF